jgi:hypothetical protein
LIQKAAIRKAAIRSQCKTTQHWLQAQIFGENARLRRNTVNGCFPGGWTGPPTAQGKPVNRALVQFDYWRIRIAIALPLCPAFRLA